jgi:LemA protein
MGLVLLIAVVGLAVFAVKTYNRLRVDSEDVKRARADVIATMKKRMDTAQRLVDIASQYGEHEKLSHFTIGEMQSDPAGVRSTEHSIGHVVSEIRTLAAHYPDLKANQTYQQLMHHLEALEERILKARTDYNQAVSTYNTARSEFPTVLIAPHFGFPEAPYFDVDGDGLDQLAAFKTDDGTMLKAQMARAAGRVTAAIQPAIVQSHDRPPAPLPNAVEPR